MPYLIELEWCILIYSYMYVNILRLCIATLSDFIQTETSGCITEEFSVKHILFYTDLNVIPV